MPPPRPSDSETPADRRGAVGPGPSWGEASDSESTANRPAAPEPGTRPSPADPSDSESTANRPDAPQPGTDRPPAHPSDSESTANRRQTAQQRDDQGRRDVSESTANRRPTGSRTGHYFSATPSARSKPGRVTLRLPDLVVDDHDPGIRLRTDAEVFSGKAVDPGTLFLLTDGPGPPVDPRPDGSARTLVDVGCGYGPITVALALRAPGAEVWAVDVNDRALALCRANADALGIGDRVRTATPDQVPADLVVDGIWSNPPIRIGKPALHALLTSWLARLAPEPDAAAHLVVARNLGADSLARWLGEQGHAVSRRASRRGYRLLDVTR